MVLPKRVFRAGGMGGGIARWFSEFVNRNNHLSTYTTYTSLLKENVDRVRGRGTGKVVRWDRVVCALTAWGALG